MTNMTGCIHIAAVEPFPGMGEHLPHPALKNRISGDPPASRLIQSHEVTHRAQKGNTGKR